MIKLYSLITANYNAQYYSSTSFVTFFEKGWGIECEYTFNFYTSILLLNIVFLIDSPFAILMPSQYEKSFPRTLIIDPNIRDHFSIVVLTNTPPATPPPQKKNPRNKSKTVIISQSMAQ